QLAFGIAECAEQALHAIERQIDALGMQRGQPRDDGIDWAHVTRTGAAMTSVTRAQEPAVAAVRPQRAPTWSAPGTARPASAAICADARPYPPCRARRDIRRAGNLPAVSREWSAR